MGAADAIYRDGGKYVIARLITRKEANEYDRVWATAMLMYGSKCLGVEEGRVMFHFIGGEEEKKMLFSPVEEDRLRVRDMIRNIRHTKKYADAFFRYHSFHPRVLPNMKHPSGVWDVEKKRFAEEIGEITRLWGCSVINRERALMEGVSSWRDDRCNADLLGFTGHKKTIVDAMMDINRQEDGPWYRMHTEVVLDVNRPIYVDFEWIDHVYLIGAYDPETNAYEAFWADSLTENDIRDMYKRFMERVGDRTIMYWHAEAKKWASDLDRLGMADDGPRRRWLDLCSVMRNGVVVRGAFGFGLKEMTRVFHEKGEMPYYVDEMECQNGLDSILFAEEYYRTRDDQVRRKIEEYNRFDCEAMYHIARVIFFPGENKNGVQRGDNQGTDSNENVSESLLLPTRCI
jgi:hypothetical protein